MDYDNAVNDLNLAEAAARQLKAADPQVKVKEAEAAVEAGRGATRQGDSGGRAVRGEGQDRRHHRAGDDQPGTTMGVSTRAPALWLIPAGPRVVRAEVEAEFAHRVGPDIVGKTVTISDHTDPKLTYTGMVRRVAGRVPA